MRGNLRVFICLLVAQITVGCTQYHYEYIPPTDSEGVNCTRRCMDRKWDCSNNCQANYSDCIESEKKNIVVDALIKSVVSAVVLRTSKPVQDAQVSQCQQHNKTCTDSCSSYYNDCYQNCGGVVNVYEKK